MYQLKVESSFDAAHRLPKYNGPCSRVHGHHWVVQATWATDTLGENGIAIDLVALRRLLRQALCIYDHQSLNQIMSCTPTSENLARITFERLQKLDFGSYLTQVAVEETPGTCAVYCKDKEVTRLPHRGD